ncbi:hypothetical protein DL765_001959 [Monosporascus sp. GIB2]|nr:hypothetical protein DL765_001959 [Monosporascus sp. GIB2]
MANTQPEKGDKVSWKWGSGAPEGTDADPDNLAIRIGRSGNDVVKGASASQLTVKQKASGNKEENGEAQGEKHKAEDEAGDEAGEETAQDATTANKHRKEASKKQMKTQDEDSKAQREGEAEVT